MYLAKRVNMDYGAESSYIDNNCKSNNITYTRSWDAIKVFDTLEECIQWLQFAKSQYLQTQSDEQDDLKSEWYKFEVVCL